MTKMLAGLLAALATVCFAQAPTSGIAITVRPQKVKKLPDAYGKHLGTETLLDIQIVNALNEVNSFTLEVVFIGVYDQGTVNKPKKFNIMRKLIKFPASLRPMERQDVSADSVLRFNDEQEPNATYPARQHTGFSQCTGWIVRAMRDGVVVKLLASSPALERMAADPYILSCLESGQSIPVK